MDTTEMAQLALLLADARREGRQIGVLPSALVPPSNADGIAVNALVARELGWPELGWKIAATSPEMQRRLRASEPICGRTFSRFAVESPAELDHSQLLDPIVECEFFFRLGRALPQRVEAWTTDEVVDAVADLHAGIEVAECRFPLDRLPPIPAILADGAASGRYVIGPRIDGWRQRDLAAMSVSLEVDGRVRRTGHGRDVMGHPMAPLVWLANARSRAGEGLAAGALVSTGTATGMLLARRGERMRARFGDKATVEVTFT